MENARSIHIGLNNVNPDCYGGWDGQLSGCINDANDMKAIADRLGYDSRLLIDSAATADNVVAEIGEAANALHTGDILMISYSGHGGQVPDVNGDENEGLDETWCLWDRQLIDDELYSLWGRFRPGVRIVVLSDSCHSGTVLRMLQTQQDMTKEYKNTRDPMRLAALEAMNKVLGITTPVHATDESTKTTQARGMRAEIAPPESRKVYRRMPNDVQTLVNQSRASTNAAAQWMAGPAERATVAATALLISGCQDAQLSRDGSNNGLFTEKLKTVWNNGSFAGTYKEFCEAIKQLMPDDQMPNYLVVGAANPAFEMQSPFKTANVGGGVALPSDSSPGSDSNSNNSNTPSTDGPTGSRPNLRQGDSGSDVKYLQDRLVDLGYNVTVDGVFGWRTASAVRAFQAANGLVVDGVVGKETWNALG